ncbi:ABC transporter substrate-binding protein [Desulfopila sp. IMCC35008]|uniref:ABC transporter substrate-binding protein n=1 Tax=Desulfopila sp. IMCC35008 TaxID=2653858 RepID=UPI0013D2EC04|nr:ABC transporter substrate-binding protein [Desulfopila sp. IMCC35008]
MHALKDIEHKLRTGALTRREFIAALSALGLSAAACPSLLGGNAFAADMPQKGGRFRLGLSGGSTTDVLDPAQTTDTVARFLIFGSIGNNLVEIDHQANAVPELAESWEASPDARKWVFKLRKGVEFHNGKTLDADDVLYSMNHHRGKDSKSGGKGLVKAIVDIKKIDNLSVAFELESGNADFPYLLSDYHFVIGPKDDGFNTGIYTGAYILKDFEPGVRAFATRNPNYFKPDRGWFDELEILVINDVNARTNALKTGQIDAMNRCELKTVHLMKRMPGIEILKQDGYKHYTFAMQTDQAPYNNNDVRLALKYGIDREQMVKTILRGYGTVGNDHPISPSNRFFAKDLPQRTFDPDKAKFHLKKAGLEKTTFSLHTADAAFVGAVDAGVLYKEQAAKAGIDIKVVREPNDGYWSNVWMKKPFCAVYWGGRPTEDMMFSTSYARDAAWNDTSWDNEKFNQLLVAARSELDEAKRRTMYADMQEIVRDDGGVVVPMFSSDLAACNDKVGHGPLAVNWEVDGNKAAERWWFKK